MSTTDLGYHYPAGDDETDGPGAVQRLAEDVDASPGVSSLSGATIAGLAGALKRAGRLVWNTTTGTLQRSDGSAWKDLPVVSDATPEAVTTGTPAVGTALTAARGDHSHALPEHDHSTTAKGGTVPQASVTGLTSALAGKAASSHAHAAADVTGLATAWGDTYSPTLTASGGNPNLGSTGTATGAAKIIGKTCDWAAEFVFSGTGVSAGSGVWIVSLPATPAGGYRVVGHGYMYLAVSGGGSAWYRFELDKAVGGARIIGADGPISAPAGLAAGTVMSLTGRFEIS